MTLPPALDIVIVTFNARADVMACLASLHAHPAARPWRVIVVDNASRDGTPDAVVAQWPAVSLRRLRTNVGFAGGNAAGIAEGSAPLVLLLNSDTLVEDGAIEGLCAVLDGAPDIGVVGPRLEDGAGRPELSFGPMIGPWNEARQKLAGWALTRGPRPWARRVAARLDRAQDVDWVSGACLLTRRAVYEGVGGLDTRYFMYAEDVDYCAAVRRAGYRVHYTPTVRIVHLRGRSRAAAQTATTAHYRRSHLAFYQKHHPRWARVLQMYLRLKGALPPG